MEAKDLANKIFRIINILKENEGVAIFASEKIGFENWLKVELSRILNHYGNTLPEENRMDIVFNDEWAISLKDRKKNGQNVLDNLDELKEEPYNNYSKTCLVFLTFAPNGRKIRYDENIENALKGKNRVYFKKDFTFNKTIFKDNNEGRIWFVIG